VWATKGDQEDWGFIVPHPKQGLDSFDIQALLMIPLDSWTSSVRTHFFLFFSFSYTYRAKDILYTGLLATYKPVQYFRYKMFMVIRANRIHEQNLL